MQLCLLLASIEIGPLPSHRDKEMNSAFCSDYIFVRDRSQVFEKLSGERIYSWKISTVNAARKGRWRAYTWVEFSQAEENIKAIFSHRVCEMHLVFFTLAYYIFRLFLLSLSFVPACPLSITVSVFAKNLWNQALGYIAH